MQVRIKAIRWEAEDILSFILEPVGGGLMPAFDPGAHIDVQLAPGLARSYSLANDPAIRGSYEIGVHLSPSSRGGSRHIHERWRAGDVVEISNRKTTSRWWKTPPTRC
jgi:vanillate O-demethylase ferredoxin subunit